MANMSYCRNENTFFDLADAIQHIHEVASNQRDEKYRIRLIEAMIEFVESGEAEEALEVKMELEEE